MGPKPGLGLFCELGDRQGGSPAPIVLTITMGILNCHLHMLPWHSAVVHALGAPTMALLAENREEMLTVSSSYQQQPQPDSSCPQPTSQGHWSFSIPVVGVVSADTAETTNNNQRRGFPEDPGRGDRSFSERLEQR